MIRKGKGAQGVPWVTTMEARSEGLDCFVLSATTTSFPGVLFNIFFSTEKSLKKFAYFPKGSYIWGSNGILSIHAGPLTGV